MPGGENLLHKGLSKGLENSFPTKNEGNNSRIYSAVRGIGL